MDDIRRIWSQKHRVSRKKCLMESKCERSNDRLPLNNREAVSNLVQSSFSDVGRGQ